VIELTLLSSDLCRDGQCPCPSNGVIESAQAIDEVVLAIQVDLTWMAPLLSLSVSAFLKI